MKAFLLLFTVAFGALAAECPNTDFDHNYTPTVKSDQTLCYEEYESQYDYGTKSVIWVGEYLHKGEQFQHERKNQFAPNMDIPEPSRTTPKDYKEPLYDQGHMAPAGDMVSENSQRESFLMSNMVPQTPHLNRGIWKHLEDSLRKLSKDNDVIVITGPIYGVNVEYIGNHVPVPAFTWKWVYNLTTHTEIGYVMPNILDMPSKNLEDYVCTKTDIQKMTGIILK